jgi:hypothetical protein
VDELNGPISTKEIGLIIEIFHGRQQQAQASSLANSKHLRKKLY